MLSIYNDNGPGHWGMQLWKACQFYDEPARLFRGTSYPDQEARVTPESLYFVRPEQKSPLEGALWAMARNCKGIQGIPTLVEYERKDLQYAAYAKHMPKSYFVNRPSDLKSVYRMYLDKGDRFTTCVLKLPHGSGSKNVHLVYSLGDLMDLGQRLTWPEGQAAILQTLIPELDGVWRATRVGKGYGWLYFNHNRSHEAKASGSGLFTPMTERGIRSNEAETKLVWDFANSIWDSHGQNWGGMDIALDNFGNPVLIETTLAWGLHVTGAHKDSLIIDRDRQPVLKDGNMQYGANQWRFLIDRIRAGDFK